MGWKSKLLAGFLGLVLVGAGLWPLGAVFLLFLLLSSFLRPREIPSHSSGARSFPHPRLVVGFSLVVLSAVASASGGSLSPIVLLAAGLVLLGSPIFENRLPLAEVVPLEGTILLRSRYFPFSWHAVAQWKPGPDEFPRTAASGGGVFFVQTDSGRTFSLSSCLALDGRSAEAKLLSMLRASALAARTTPFLLPLDSTAAADLLRPRLARLKLPAGGAFDAIPPNAALLVLQCGGGRVVRAAAYEAGRPGAPRIPGKGVPPRTSPLTWEVFEALGKRTRWPEPDAYSNLLDSMAATRGVPIGERLREFQSSEDGVTVKSLSGEEVKTTRAQLRAIVSIYS